MFSVFSAPAVSPLLAPTAPACAPATSLDFTASEAVEVAKDGGHGEDEEDEPDKEVDDRKVRFLGFERERFDRFGDGLCPVRGVEPRRAMLQQRLCWLGVQFEQRLFCRVHTQVLQEPEPLQPQHFGIVVELSSLYPKPSETGPTA